MPIRWTEDITFKCIKNFPKSSVAELFPDLGKMIDLTTLKNPYTYGRGVVKILKWIKNKINEFI